MMVMVDPIHLMIVMVDPIHLMMVMVDGDGRSNTPVASTPIFLTLLVVVRHVLTIAT